jgi:hypothetical protein
MKSKNIRKNQKILLKHHRGKSYGVLFGLKKTRIV